MIYGSRGRTVNLSCQVENYYNGTTVGWKLEDRVLASDGVKYKIINQQNSDKLNTHLMIMDTAEADFNTYKCFLDTPEGLRERKVELRDGNNSYSYIVGIIANVTGVIIVLSVLFFLYWRRRLRINSVKNMENQKEIFKTEDKSVMQKLLLKNDNFRIDLEFNCDDLINESPELDLKKAKRLNRFYSAPNGSFASDNTVLSFVHD